MGETYPPELIAGFVVTLLIAGAIYYYLETKKSKRNLERMNSMQDFAAKNGFKEIDEEAVLKIFSRDRKDVLPPHTIKHVKANIPQDLAAALHFPKGMEFYGGGEGPTFINTFWAVREGRDVFIMDYEYYTLGMSFLSKSRKRTIYMHTLIHIRVPSADLPSFIMRPERFTDKAKSLVGFQDIDFKENAGFSSKYLLRGKNEAGIRKLFKPALLAHLESADEMILAGSGDVVVACETGKFSSPPQLPELLTRAERTCQLLMS